MNSMQYYSFEKVLKELQMEEDELKRLVSEGEIRAFRDDDKMKFKKSDIDGLKKGRMTEPTIILPSGEPDESSEDSEVLLVEEDTSETLLDIDDIDSAEASSTSVPTVDFSSSDSDFEDDSSDSETITEELTFEEDSGSYVLESSDDVLIDSADDLMGIGDEEAGGDTFIDSETGLQTEPLENEQDLDESDSFDVLDEEEQETFPVEDEEEDEDLAITTPEEEEIGDSTAPIQISSSTGIVVQPQPPLSPVMSALLVAGTAFLLITGLVMVNLVREVDTPATGWLTDTTFRIFPTQAGYRGSSKSEQAIEKRLQWRQERREGKVR